MGSCFCFKGCVTTLVLGSQLMQGHGKLRAKNATQESQTHSQEFEKVWKSELTHSQVLPFWKLKSQWTPKFLENG